MIILRFREFEEKLGRSAEELVRSIRFRATPTRLGSLREDEEAACITSLRVLCAGVCAVSQHPKATTEAQGLRQHDKLQRRREAAPLRVRRPDPRALGLAGGGAGIVFPHRAQQQRVPRAVHARLG